MLTTEPNSRIKLLDAALAAIRSKDYTVALLDGICAAAGVNTGSYFHYFESKEAMALQAVEHWNTMTGGLFAQAPYTRIKDPRDRVLAYVDFRSEILQGDLPDFTCLPDTMLQETLVTHPRRYVAALLSPASGLI